MLDLNYFLNLESYIDVLKNTHLPIFIYGMGDGCVKLMKIFDEYSLPCAGIFASDEFVRNKVFLGHRIHRLSEIEESVGEFIAVLAFGAGYSELMDKIDLLAEKHRLIVPDMPVAGDGLFTKDYLKANFSKLEKVYSMLSDEQSRLCMRSLIEFRITGSIGALKLCESTPEEAYENIIRPSESEIYADLGAYTGDTVLQFINRVGGKYEKIIAIEPNERNLKKLKENTMGLENIYAIGAAAADYDGTTTVTKGSGRMIRRSQSGVSVRCVKLDTVLNGEKCTYIKYDVEGSELSALKGSENTIKKYAPKLCAAIYHRVEDIFELPLYVGSLRQDYRLYMRHFPCYPAWDTNLYAAAQPKNFGL